MNRLLYVVVLLFSSFFHTSEAMASDACSTRAVATAADVAVSDGMRYKTATNFQSKNAASLTFIRDQTSSITVEGPYAWSRSDDGDKIGSDGQKSFALGHQFHAILLYFAEIASDIHSVEAISFQGKAYAGYSGKMPYGGSVTLLTGEDKSRPVAMLYVTDEGHPINITFGDWRSTGDVDLPYLVKINDGMRVFDYNYTHISLESKNPLWFMSGVPNPMVDEVQIYRSHRKILIAHCIGDAEMMASLTNAKGYSIEKGTISEITPSDTRVRFTKVFSQVDYSEYHDISEPIIEVAASGDIGWLIANIKAKGKETSTGDPFDFQYSWVMLVKKINGQWLNAGVAASLLEE